MGGRYTVGYVYMVEMAPQKYYHIIGTCWDVTESIVFIVTTLYYWFISKNWKYLITAACGE